MFELHTNNGRQLHKIIELKSYPFGKSDVSGILHLFSLVSLIIGFQ